MNQQPRSRSQLRRLTLSVRPEKTFPVPISDGYSVYSALLRVLSDVNEDVSAHIHDSPLGSLHSSGLQGVFGGSERDYHKTVRADQEYRLMLGIVDPADAEIFQALVNALVLEGETLELTNGTLRIETFESENVTHAELLERAGSLEDPTIEIDFQTATCIEETDEVTTMFPHRGAVFASLAGKWNRTAPEEYLQVDFAREAIEASVIEKPDPRSYDTHSVLVNRVRNEAGESRNIFRQGFSGRCSYAFKDASESIRNAVTVLALFGEYSGIGSAIARGCGHVAVGVANRE